ncbi:hypothetical protein [Methanoculleus sp. 7T]|uniref:hypothetical protein n=1 Tax=Methanoculleus sp. 7T TaxID=2937282 RepID=UPI0020BED1CB|nr:hypothetical protein [Methanoculleus sp. 7T]MCK8517402.1 hypothetical protein [Methanoculleus sp. 7T]
MSHRLINEHENRLWPTLSRRRAKRFPPRKDFWNIPSALKSEDELAADTLPEFLKPTWVAQEETNTIKS